MKTPEEVLAQRITCKACGWSGPGTQLTEDQDYPGFRHCPGCREWLFNFNPTPEPATGKEPW